MKTRNIILLALTAIFAASCHTWDDPSVIDGRNSYGNQYLQESNVVTLADLKAEPEFKDVISSGSLKQVTKPTQIKVIVTGNDEGSNIYKTLYVADKTGGISISINKGGLFSEAPVGQCMLIELNGLYIGGYGQQPQVGIKLIKTNTDGTTSTQVGRMDRYTWQEHFKLIPAVKGLSTKPIKTNDMGMLDLDRDFGKVVTLVGVTMKEADGEKVFAPSEGVKLSGGCANREVANQSTTVYVRTSTFAKFANMVMPTEKINITGILSRFANDIQIMPRTIEDIQPYDGLDYEYIEKKEGDGTAAKPFNVTAAIAKCREVGTTTSSQKYYIKGYVAADAAVDATYGNITFDIADSKDGGPRFIAYQMAGSDGKSLPATFKLSKGDEVVIYGKVVNYKDSTPETEGQGKSIIVSVNGKDTNGASTGGGDNPGDGGDTPGGGSDTPGGNAQVVTIAQFNAAAVSTDVWYQLTGTVSNIKEGDKYGNFDLTDETGTVYVYGLLSEKGGAKQKFQDLVTAKGIANGKKITIIGNRGDFNGKIEVMNAYFVSIE